MNIKKITIIFLLFGFQISTFAQEKTSFRTDFKAEISIPITIGLVLKGKKIFLNSNHFEGFAGIALQQTYLSSKMFKKSSNSLDKTLANSGIYLISEFVYFPFNSKHLFLSLEPFVGITRYSTKSSIDLPKYQITGDYSASFTYLNYGVTHGLGWKFKRFAVKVDLMLSYKGFLHKKGIRYFDPYLFLFPELSFSWTF